MSSVLGKFLARHKNMDFICICKARSFDFSMRNQGILKCNLYFEHIEGLGMQFS